MNLGKNISWKIGQSLIDKDRAKNYTKFEIAREVILYRDLFGLIRLNVCYPIMQSFKSDIIINLYSEQVYTFVSKIISS